MKKLISILACICFTTLAATAQQNAPAGENPKQGGDTENSTAIWTGNFAGGQIMIHISKIVSVAQQKYVLDGQFLVYEVAIDTIGNSLTRIYYIEPLAESASGATNIGANTFGRAKELMGMAQDRTGTSHINPLTVVTKNYPTTTHAHTIEYRVATLDELNGVYKSVATAFQRGKGRSYTAANK